MLKVAIVLLLLATPGEPVQAACSSWSRTRASSSRVVNSLTVRVVLAAATLVLVAWGFYSGELNSHAPWHF